MSVAAWNVANFFDTIDSPNDDEVLRPDQWEEKLAEAGSVLGRLDADFVGLVEVENLDCLRALNQTLRTPYPQLGLIEGNDQRGIDVAFLSRLPVARVVSHRDYDLPDAWGVSKRYRFSRDCLLVELATDPPITILLNHFKSQLGAKKEGAAKRRVQAQGVADIAAGAARALPEGIEVVMGDLNDRPDSWSLEPLMGDFVDVFAGWPQNLRATHRSKHGNTPLDYILVSPDGQARIEDPRVWQELGKATSDHDPVSVRLRLDGQPLSSSVPDQEWSKSD